MMDNQTAKTEHRNKDRINPFNRGNFLKGAAVFPFSDLNNIEIANLLSDFLKEKKLDACADRNEEVHQVLLTKVFPRQADVITK